MQDEDARRGPDDPPPPGRSPEACPGAATYRCGRTVMLEVRAVERLADVIGCP
jgi:hypothetical protein